MQAVAALGLAGKLGMQGQVGLQQACRSKKCCNIAVQQFELYFADRFMAAVCLDSSPIKRQFDTRAALLFDLPGVADEVGRKNRDQLGAQRFEQMPQFFVIDMRKVEFAR